MIQKQTDPNLKKKMLIEKVLQDDRIRDIDLHSHTSTLSQAKQIAEEYASLLDASIILENRQEHRWFEVRNGKVNLYIHIRKEQDIVPPF